MTVLNRASAVSVKRELLPVLWVQLKAVYSMFWSRLVLARERKQKPSSRNLHSYLKTFKQRSSFIPKRLTNLGITIGFPVHTQPAGRQNKNVVLIILTFHR